MVMSSTSMDISETFRPEDLSKTDFFDFVTAPEMGIGVDRPPGNDANGNVDQPLQGYDQVGFFFKYIYKKKIVIIIKYICILTCVTFLIVKRKV